MIVLGGNDLFKVRFSSLIADYDRDTMVNLYQPIVGFTAMAIYFSLWTLSENDNDEYLAHESLFNRMQIAPGKFVESRKMLEATGLLKTYIKSYDSGKKYSYVLYAPKAPRDFFNNTLLYGMLVKCVGTLEASMIKSNYCEDSIEESGEEISEKFNDVFRPDFDDPAFMFAVKQKDSALGRTTAKISSGFDYKEFFDELKNGEINENSFSSKEMKEIERLALLNGLSEEKVASVIENAYDPNLSKGKRIDFELLGKLLQEESNMRFIKKADDGFVKSNLLKGDSDLASKINLMETICPKDYLTVLQDGTQPAKSDLLLINDLSSKFALRNSVINALLDFVLASNNNVLSRSYTEKIAASLKREGVLTTIDAMNYLRKVTKNRRKKEETKKIAINIPKRTQITVSNSKVNNDESVSWNQLIDEIDEEDDANGKA